MSLAMHLRKLVYLTTPVLLLFTFAGSASAQTLAQGLAATGPPASGPAP